MASRTSVAPPNTVRRSPNVFRGRLLVDLPPHATPIFTGTHERFTRPEGTVQHALWVHPRAGRMHTEHGKSSNGTIEWWTHVVEPRRHTSMPAFSMGYANVHRDRDAWVDLGPGDGHGNGHGDGHGNGHGDGHGDGSLMALARLLVVRQLEPVSFADDFDMPRVHLWPKTVRHLDQWSSYAQLLYRAYWDALEDASYQRGVVTNTRVRMPEPVRYARETLFGKHVRAHDRLWWPTD